MADFNIAPEIGGVDTTDLTRGYSPDEQKAVIDHVFGDSSSESGLTLPSGQELYVGRRRASEKYSIGRGSGIFHGLPALFVPSLGERALLTVRSGGGFDHNGLDSFEGFLPTSVSQMLSLGKHTMREVVAGGWIDFKPKASRGHVEARDYLTQWILGDALLTDPDEDPDEDFLESLNVGIEDFLGEELTTTERHGIAEGDGGMFEAYVAEMIRRLAMTRATDS